MLSIAANDLKTRGIAAIEAGLEAQTEAVISVRGKERFVVMPLAQWPQQYWRLLLATPSLRHAAKTEPNALLPGIARLAPERRAAVLLHLVAGLEDDVAAAALGPGSDPAP